MKHSTPIFAALFAIVLCLFSSLALTKSLAQQQLPDLNPLRSNSSSPPPQVTSPPVAIVSQDEIQAKRKEILESKDLNEAGKEKALAHLTAAADFSSSSLKLAARADEDDRAARAAAPAVGQLREKLTRLREAKPQAPLATDKLADLEQQRNKREADLASSRTELSRLEGESARRVNARKQIREELLTLPRDIEQLSKNIATPVDKEPPLLAAARIMELTAHRAMRLLRLRALENERARYDAEAASDTLRLQRDIQDRIVTLAEAELRLLDDRVKVLREEAAQEAVRKAHQEVAQATPRLKPYAERNQQLAQAAQKLNPKLTAAEENLRKSKEVYDALWRQFVQTKQKVTSIGLTNSVGSMLRKRRLELPDTGTLKHAIRARQETIEDVQFELFSYEEERGLDRAAMLAEMVPGNEQDAPASEQAAKFLIDRRDEYLDAIIRTYNSYFDTLVELSTTEQQLVNLTKTYVDYVDERVLWTRSGRPLHRHWAIDESSYWFLDPQRWRKAGVEFLSDLRKNLAIWIVAGLLFVGLIISGQKFRQQITRLGTEAEAEDCVTFKPTRQTFVLTLLVSLSWPGLIAFLGWRLSAGSGVLNAAIGNALKVVVVAIGPLEVLRHVCRAHGLAESHFAMPRKILQILRLNLRFLIGIAVPLLFVTASLHFIDPMHGDAADERVCFILLSLVLCLFLRRVLHPVKGAVSVYVSRHEGGWIDRLKYVWFWLGSLCPLIFAALAVAGYYYTAVQLSWRLYGSVCLLIGVLLLAATITRLLVIRQRQLAQRQQEAEPPTDGPDPGVADIIPLESEEGNLEDHQEQSRRLLGVFGVMLALIGLWLIWVDVLPALKMLDQYTVFGSRATTPTPALTSAPASPAPSPTPMAVPKNSDPSPPEKASAQTTTPSVVDPISISDVLLTILIIVVVFASARDIPGLLEITILQRLPLDTSLRYAITTIAKYAIFLVGIILVGSTLGLRWNQIQWLATALTFGLAFGLQEIFANFVAGLIMLFERPIRVGDVITIGDVTGVVSRIRMRATTITDWDRKDYVVPNKEFITGRLLNWTLSDTVNRVVVDVGIAYGSDTDLACRILLDIAKQHPLILDEPQTRATFEGFGDSTLIFRLRTFLPALKHRLQVIHELHSTIHERFAEHGIEIAFPQRDLHLRSDDRDQSAGPPLPGLTENPQLT